MKLYRKGENERVPHLLFQQASLYFYSVEFNTGHIENEKRVNKTRTLKDSMTVLDHHTTVIFIFSRVDFWRYESVIQVQKL